MDNETNIIPWCVDSGKINYSKLILQFGCHGIDGKLIQRFEEVTGVRAHVWLRRGLFFSHRDLKLVLDAYEKCEDIFIYTGRGPSTGSLHLGHMVPFMFTKFLQDAFNAIVIIQLSDDEKFHFKKEKTLEEYTKLAYENAKDILACGFDVEKTFIFSNTDTVGCDLYKTAVKLMSSITGNQIKGIYGLNLDNSIGQLSWPCFQAAPAFSQSFPNILGNTPIRCLIPMAIDQDPYFRMARDFANKYKNKGFIKPAAIHSKFLPSLNGHSKMSSTGENTEKYTIFMSDTQDQIKNKIKKYAFSGGCDTLKKHRRYGGNLKIDIPYQYLTYFLDDDDELRRIANEYGSGRMNSSQIKTITSNVICSVVQNHQNFRADLSINTFTKFFNKNRYFDTQKIHRNNLDTHDHRYFKTGCDFDIYFNSLNIVYKQLPVIEESELENQISDRSDKEEK